MEPRGTPNDARRGAIYQCAVDGSGGRNEASLVQEKGD